MIVLSSVCVESVMNRTQCKAERMQGPKEKEEEYEGKIQGCGGVVRLMYRVYL